MMEKQVAILDFKIINEKFKSSSGKIFDKTAFVTFSKNGEIKEKKLAYFPFGIIDFNANNFDFSDCFVHEFSISRYKEDNNLEFFEFVDLENFNAKNAVFYSEKESLDFSFIRIKNKHEINFSNSTFIARKLNFSNVIFDTLEEVNFENSTIYCSDVDFSNANFGKGNCIFSNCYFSEGTIKFEKARFGKGNKLFVNTHFDDGNVCFDNCFFDDGKVSFKIAHFGKGRKDFNFMEFKSGEVIFERVIFGSGNINFKETHFRKGNVNFKKVNFGDGNLIFRYSTFGNGNISFMNSKFKNGKVSFAYVEFGEGKKDFRYAEFGEGDIIFERTNFGKGLVDFSTVDFGEGKVNFKKTVLNDDLVNFEASTLKSGSLVFDSNMFSRGELNFVGANYYGASLNFNGINLGQKAINFSKGKFGEIRLTSCQLDNNINLKVQYIGHLDLSHSIVRGVIDIESSEYEIQINSINFLGLRLLGTMYIDWNRLNLKELIYKQDNTYLEKADQFRMLKENFNSIGHYSDEDDAYVEFKRTEAKSNYYKSIQRNPKMKLCATSKYLFEKLLFDKTGLYATSPTRVIFGMLFVYIFFSLLYYFLHFFSDSALVSGVGNPDGLGFLATSFYHSAVTFLTIGYGDIYPTGVLRAISGVEGFIGVFFMSYFTVAFVRKILR